MILSAMITNRVNTQLSQSDFRNYTSANSELNLVLKCRHNGGATNLPKLNYNQRCQKQLKFCKMYTIEK